MLVYPTPNEIGDFYALLRCVNLQSSMPIWFQIDSRSHRARVRKVRAPLFLYPDGA